MIASVGFCILAFGVLRLLKSDYLRFMEDKNQRYYSEFARACDSVLAQHPLGTNTFICITGADPSLPKIIRDLESSRVTISSNSVHLMVGAGRGGFGILWAQNEAQTNVWTISTFAESMQKVAYTETR
ncbi:MAG: hypothetical protein QM813_12310 [Verrucomicrobiota bacterium]